MFSFSFIRRNMRRGAFARNAFALFVVFCLSAALFTGCKSGSDPYYDNHKLKTALIGTWEDEGEWGTDGYVIKAKELSYFDSFGYDYKGTIEYVSNFSDYAGVIIIKYTEVGSELANNLIGKYIGVYYKDLKSNDSVGMGTAMNSDYTNPAKNTMYDAAITFTVENEGTYMTYYGTYPKKP
jgi:hypothetical protein